MAWKASCVVILEIPAGSVVLITEAVMHGTAPFVPSLFGDRPCVER